MLLASIGFAAEQGMHAFVGGSPARRVIGLERAAAPILYDVPVSNNGAKVRLLIYKKGLDVEIAAPSALGGMKSEEYVKLSPEGKMPAMLCEDGQTGLCESQVILDYLSDKYSDVGPSFVPATAEGRAKAALIARLADLYIVSIQGAMYRGPMDIATRAANIAEIDRQLDILERAFEGPYAAGSEMSTGDFSLFPTFVFMTYILPRHFGWEDVFKGRPKLRAWWDLMLTDADVKKVFDEVDGALKKWEADGRWEKVGVTEHVKDAAFQWAF